MAATRTTPARIRTYIGEVTLEEYNRYQPNSGAMKLRQAICNCSNDLSGSRVTPAQGTVTSSGMQGLMDDGWMPWVGPRYTPDLFKKIR